jgi:hypothetical protein
VIDKLVSSDSRVVSSDQQVGKTALQVDSGNSQVGKTAFRELS